MRSVTNASLPLRANERTRSICSSASSRRRRSALIARLRRARRAGPCADLGRGWKPLRLCSPRLPPGPATSPLNRATSGLVRNRPRGQRPSRADLRPARLIQTREYLWRRVSPQARGSAPGVSTEGRAASQRPSQVCYMRLECPRGAEYLTLDPRLRPSNMLRRAFLQGTISAPVKRDGHALRGFRKSFVFSGFHCHLSFTPQRLSFELVSLPPVRITFPFIQIR